MADNTVKHVIRFPRDVYAKLRKLAELEDRSINGQVIATVKAYIEKHEQLYGPVTPAE